MPILRLGGFRPVSPQVSEVPTTGGLIRKGHAPTEARGAFGLGTAQTIGARPPLGLREFVPQTLATARQFGRSLVTGDVSSALHARSQLGPSVGLDVANAAFLPASVGVEQASRLMAGQPLRPASVVTRQALQGFPEDDRLTRAVRLGLETGAINAAPAALRGVGAGLIRLGRAASRMTEPVRILRAPVEQLVTRAKVSGQEAATILRTLREAKSPKYQPVFNAVQAQRQAPRRPIALLTSERGAAALPPVPIEPGDLVRFGKQLRRVVSVDHTTQKAVLAVGAGRTITAPLTQLLHANTKVAIRETMGQGKVPPTITEPAALQRSLQRQATAATEGARVGRQQGRQEQFVVGQQQLLRRSLAGQGRAFVAGEQAAGKVLVTPQQSLARQGRAFEAGFRRGTDEQKAQLIAAFRQQTSDINAI